MKVKLKRGYRISKKVTSKVIERDKCCCIICGQPYVLAENRRILVIDAENSLDKLYELIQAGMVEQAEE